MVFSAVGAMSYGNVSTEEEEIVKIYHQATASEDTAR
jgi:hypothetical protein